MLKVAGHSHVGDRDEAETWILDSTAEHTRDGLVNTVLNFALACFVCHGTPLFSSVTRSVAHDFSRTGVLAGIPS